MRLIDAEEMIKRLQEWNTKDAMDTALFNFALHRILEQPTAYDVDEVVKQLNEKKENLGFIKTITDTSAYIKGINDARANGRIMTLQNDIRSQYGHLLKILKKQPIMAHKNLLL